MTLAGENGASQMTFAITSPSFTHDGEIPVKYTCEGGDTSPPLAWTGVPEGTKSFALIVDDPDAPDPAAPQRTWVHWVVYDLPGDARSIAEGAAKSGLPQGSREALNDWKKPTYGGPCPPIGRHRYFHKLYALDTVLPDLGPNAAKVELLKNMQGHVLGSTQVIGTYEKKKK